MALADLVGRPARRGPIERWGLDSLRDLPPDILYLCPQALLAGASARAAVAQDLAWPIAGGWTAAALCRLLIRDGDAAVQSMTVSVSQLSEWLARVTGPAADRLRLLADRLRAPRARWAGLALDRPRVMGIVNVTPDSFFDGGRHNEAAAAIVHGRRLLAAGAHLLDIGGESTRPGAAPLSVDEEIARIDPVIRALASEGALISVDTRRPAVMAAALDAGATVLNDVEALRQPGALDLAQARQPPVILMHMQGEPQTMQAAPQYRTAALDVFDWLQARVAAAEAAGLSRAQLLVDPGIGFGKTLGHNLEIMASLGLYHTMGTGLLLGVSRKSLIGALDRGAAPEDRLGGSLAAGLAGLSAGAQVIRVHDVAETIQAVRVAMAIAEGM